MNRQERIARREKRALGAGLLSEFRIEAKSVNVPFGREEHVLRLVTPNAVVVQTKPFQNVPVEIDKVYRSLFEHCERELRKYEGSENEEAI